LAIYLNLNVGCGGRLKDRGCFIGNVRIDIEKFASVTILADAHNLPFKHSVFEKILVFEVLEHLSSPIKALQEFARVLKDDGTIILTVPNVWYWKKPLRYTLSLYFKQHQRNLQVEETCDHKQAWDIYEFNNLAFQAKLIVTEIQWLDWYPPFKGGKLAIIAYLLRVLRPFRHIAFTHTLLKLQKRK